MVIYKRSRTIGIVGSVVTHLLLIFLYINSDLYVQVGTVSENSEMIPTDGIVEVRLLFNEEIKEISSITPQESISEKKIPYPANTEMCRGKDKSYEGVGVIYNIYTNRIIYAPEYYPGYKAGLRIDDLILNVGDPIFDGHIVFHIVRGDQNITYKIKVDNICYSDG